METPMGIKWHRAVAIAFMILRWLALVPAYMLFTAFYAAWVMSLFLSYHDAWRGHLDLILFFCAVLESTALCLLSASIAPFFKKLVGVVAVLATIGLSLNRWSLVLAAEGLTWRIVAEQAAYISGGLLAFICLSWICSPRARMRATPLGA
jgi:hypothetical protein